MQGKSRSQLNFLRRVFVLVFFVSLLSLTVFSLQTIYSNNVIVESIKSYGIYQNGVYRDTGDALVPSPFSVKTTKIIVKNAENSTRNFTILLEYSGEIEFMEPAAKKNATTLVWEATFSPYEERIFRVLGNNLETGTPLVSVSDIFVLVVENKKPMFGNTYTNLSNSNAFNPPTNGTSRAHFEYSREEETMNMLQSIFAEQKKLDILTKSAIVLFAGLVLLVFVSGFAYLFGAREKPKIAKKPRIHIGEVYPEHDSLEPFSKYQYEESAYWKKK